jgi:hypothetical protein
VPLGITVAASRLDHATWTPASTVAETKEHGVVNGDICNQSIETPTPSLTASLADGRISAPTASAWVATGAPSTE